MKMQPMTFEEILAADDLVPDVNSSGWKSVEELGRVYTADIKRRLKTEFPEEASRFSKKTLVGVGLVLAQMEQHRSFFGMPSCVPIHADLYIASTAKVKGLDAEKLYRDFDDLMVMFGYACKGVE
ncbi:hypothetical protein GSM54_26620 [Escherichia coli]|nr:hypothetical protein [Escherichia coli]